MNNTAKDLIVLAAIAHMNGRIADSHVLFSEAMAQEDAPALLQLLDVEGNLNSEALPGSMSCSSPRTGVDHREAFSGSLALSSDLDDSDEPEDEEEEEADFPLDSEADDSDESDDAEEEALTSESSAHQGGGASDKIVLLPAVRSPVQVK